MKVQYIPVEDIYVSALNVRVEDDFGNAEEDQALISNLSRTDIKQLITVRPDGNGKYEVIIGRRRFLAVKELLERTGARTEIPCIVREDWDDQEAVKASLIENLGILRKDLDPITRAKAIKKLLDMRSNTRGAISRLARELGIPKQTLHQFLKVLELSPKMQEAVKAKKVAYRDALAIVFAQIPEDQQNRLAEEAEKGKEAFKNELQRIMEGKGKRGAPPGLLAVRLIFNPESMEERTCYEKLRNYCESKGLKVSEYLKGLVMEHVRSLGL